MLYLGSEVLKMEVPTLMPILCLVRSTSLLTPGWYTHLVYCRFVRFYATPVMQCQAQKGIVDPTEMTKT